MRTGLLGEYLSNEGYEVLWWTGDFDHYGQHQRGHNNSKLYVNERYSIRYINAKGYSKTKSFARLRYDFSVAQGFKKLSSVEASPHVIIASMPSVDLAAASVSFGKKNNIPVIVDVRDLHPDIFIESTKTLYRPMLYALTRPMAWKVSKLLHDATAIWGNSDFFVDWACKLGKRKRTDKDATFPIAYKPLNVGAFKTEEIVTNWQKKGLFLKDSLNILFIGSLSKSFDFTPIFEAARQLHSKGSKCEFYFFGSGELTSYIETHSSLIPNCHYLGLAGASHLQAAMSRSQIGLAPYINSKNFTQNMPNKAAEYLGGGLYIATSLQDGLLSNFLKNTNSGFSYSTSEDLCERLYYIENNSELANRARQAVTETFERYLSYSTISDGMRQSIENIVSQHDRI